MESRNEKVMISLSNEEVIELLKAHYPEDTNIRNLTVHHTIQDIDVDSAGIELILEYTY